MYESEWAEGLVTAHILFGPVWGRAWDSAFLRSSQETPVLQEPFIFKLFIEFLLPTRKNSALRMGQ